jgi:hypothetical protein
LRRASAADKVKTALAVARENLLGMLEASDKSALDKHEAEINKASKIVDEGLSTATSDKKLPAEQSAKFKELKDVWDAFKKTRDGQIIPAIRKGEKEAAKVLAKGIQAERFEKMNELLGALPAN